MKTQITTVTKYTVFKYRPSSTQSTRIVNFVTSNGSKTVVKFSYETGNSYERFRGDIFNVEQLNLVMTFDDIDIQRNESMYMNTETEIKERVGLLMTKGIEFVKHLIQ